MRGEETGAENEKASGWSERKEAWIQKGCFRRTSKPRIRRRRRFIVCCFFTKQDEEEEEERESEEAWLSTEFEFSKQTVQNKETGYLSCQWNKWAFFK